MMKEFTLISFDDEGGANITLLTLEKANEFLDDLIEEGFEEDIGEMFVKDFENIDSMTRKEETKYVLIKGIPIQPRVTKRVTKLEI